MAYLDGSGLAYFWSKVKKYIDARMLSSGSHIKTTVNLTAAGWTLSQGYYYQTKNITGVTADNSILVDTDNPNIECTGQASGTLTFRSTVAVAATVKVAIIS